MTAAQSVFATPELLECILLCLSNEVHAVGGSGKTDACYFVKTVHNADLICTLLSCAAVNRSFDATIRRSVPIQRQIFLLPDWDERRSWTHQTGTLGLPESLDSCPSEVAAPILNPLVQHYFPSYHFRFWHLSAEASGNRYCAFMIITRRELATYHLKRGPKILPRMLLSQPPCRMFQAMIWEERDETRDYVGKTVELHDFLIRCDAGLTVGAVHERVAQMFEAHADVSAIKLTTV